MHRQLTVILASLWVSVLPTRAMGPHELVVIANGASDDSVRLARRYAGQRRIPDANLVAVSLPEDLTRAREMTADQFRSLVFDPVLAVLRERRLDPHVLAWVYSVDFPVRVMTNPPTSLTGYTFVGGRLPPPARVSEGLYASPLYAGPSGVRGVSHYSQSFDVLRQWLGEDMPTPAMVLGVTGERGNSMAEIEACLDRGLRADAGMPTGTVYFVVNDDVRTRCRRWQFAPTVQELSDMGMPAEITRNLPQRGAPVLGIIAGSRDIHPGDAGPYMPGAMCEHLTSLAAVFESPNQTKLSAWIRAGATASCGTVLEPRSIWMKFPHVRFFVHYRSGCTMIESFYQAVRCPLQLLMVGDPLASPWKPAGARLSILGVPSRPVAGAIRLSAEVSGDGAEGYRRRLFLIDGQVVGREPVLWFDTKELAPGPHRVRCVAYRTGLMRPQVFAEAALQVAERE